MTHWIKNTECPNCGSKDNLGVYSDGSTWCWGCRKYTPPKSQEVIKSWLDKSKKNDSNINVKLPEDAQPFLPEHAKRWLSKYNLTKEELYVLSPLYSFDRDLLIFPVYGPSGILMYQGRYFGEKERHPKYLTYGAKDVLHILGELSPRIVVTEDLISAIKVSSITTAMPLWGSNIPLRLATRLSERFSRLSIWLDMNKAKESLIMRSTLSPLFEQIDSIITPLDPKEYSHEQIAEFVGR